MANDKDSALLAAAIRVKSALHALDENASGLGQGYHVEKLVEEARMLSRVVDRVTAHESTVPSGSVLPA